MEVAKRAKRAAVAVATTAALSSGMVALSAAPAQAAYDCRASIAIWRTHAFGTCSGPGWWKVAFTCKNGLGWTAYREGNWASNSSINQSTATCPAGYFGSRAWILLG